VSIAANSQSSVPNFVELEDPDVWAAIGAEHVNVQPHSGSQARIGRPMALRQATAERCGS